MDRFQVAEGYSVTAARAHVICMAILSLCLYWYWIARFKIRTRQHCVLHAYLLQDNTKWTWIKNIKCSRIYMWGTWRTQFHLRSAQLISKPVTLFAIISQSMSQWTQVRSSFLTRRLIANIWTSCIVFEQFLQPGLVHVQVWSIGTPGGDSCMCAGTESMPSRSRRHGRYQHSNHYSHTATNWFSSSSIGLAVSLPSCTSCRLRKPNTLRALAAVRGLTAR